MVVRNKKHKKTPRAANGKFAIKDADAGPQILTLSGRMVDLLNPTSDDICIEDIAAALAKINRFTGHTTRLYSVAEHSLTVSQLVPQRYALDALLHDAQEAYLGDMSGPLKSVMPEYRNLEEVWVKAIRKKFGLGPLPAAVDAADQQALALEFRGVTRKESVSAVKPVPMFGELPRSVGSDPDLHSRLFLQRYAELTEPRYCDNDHWYVVKALQQPRPAVGGALSQLLERAGG